MNHWSQALRAVDWTGWLGAAFVVLMLGSAVFAPFIAPFDPIEVRLEDRLAAPDAVHWLGTDQAGRDVFSRVIYGARASLTVGIGAVVIGALIGVSAGLFAAYKGGLGDQLVMRIIDGIAAIPLLVWAIAIVGILGVGPVQIGPVALPNEAKIVLLVGVLFSPVFGRVTYAVAQRVVRADFVKARLLQGARHRDIVLGDILPNCLSPIIVQATLLVAIGIVIEASVSFVGLGVQPPSPSWGTMLSDARSAIYSGEWWLPVFPGLAISLTVVGFNLLGDAVRDLFDPRSEARTLVA
ncbi:ABC transporter permease [Chelatococcus asaccharovorans]|uniref:Peptide/nickel transport system permease protein n=1 Tax=Chelatococcus asaccharovorans TaxID=28210 RepID=A0A2V3U926_9HYPH|nr:ABC transporter permease [Chelatococcus asaccharovorans]MBS7705624.1 ABC transporter permease [Chelatococcus asaccharovorans]PXW59963.1 peptide/nickel transport system permease protein [Chelatococcus asaccharovorans]